MTKKITFPYFPSALKYVSPLILAASIYLAFNHHPIWGGMLLLIAIVILTTNYITEIDLRNKVYNDYLSFLGLRLNNERKNFKSVNRIIITKGNYSQTINTRAQSRQMDWSDYTGTLIFDNEHTLDLLTKNDKRELILELKEFATFLKIGIEDQTTNQYFWIDVSRV